MSLSREAAWHSDPYDKSMNTGACPVDLCAQQADRPPILGTASASTANVPSAREAIPDSPSAAALPVQATL